jgi:selenoprotein W-related protein
LATALLQEFEMQIASFTLVPSDSGRFEFTVNGKLLFSKLELHRHAEPGEILGLVRKYLQENQ